MKNALARGTPEHRKWHPKMPRYLGSETLLQPQKPIWEILARLHHRVATDCSLSHPAGHKPFSCSHQGLHVSRDVAVDVMYLMSFSVRISARVFTSRRCLERAYLVIQQAGPFSVKAFDCSVMTVSLPWQTQHFGLACPWPVMVAVVRS